MRQVARIAALIVVSTLAACGGHGGGSSDSSSGGVSAAGDGSGGASSGGSGLGGTSSGGDGSGSTSSGGGTGGSSSGGTSSGGGTGGSSSGGTSTDEPITFASFYPSDIFSAPSAPLELTTTPAPAAAVTADIGTAGGTLTTTGPDGTVYTLDIPPNALAFETTITATPLQDVTGFPFDEQPANRIGVTFTPSGLKFGHSATLTIHPPNLPSDVSIGAFGYAGTGHDAHAVYQDDEPGLVTLSIDHFSGYVLTWPMKLPDWRAVAERRIEIQEYFLESMMASFIEFEQQKQKLGLTTEDDPTIGQIVLQAVKEYQQKVLIPRLNAASLGCDEGQKALTNWFAYWSQIQKFNLSGNPDVAVNINGVTYTDVGQLPDVLLATFFDHCMSELYERCVATGDFFQLPLFMVTLERQWELIGEDIDPAMFATAIDYTKRCGHWKLDEDATFITMPTPDIVAQGTVTTSVNLEWTPGDGAGILQFADAKIETAVDTSNPGGDNNGELVVTNFNVSPKDPGECTLTKDPPVPLRKARAKLRQLEFEYPDDPASPDWAKSGYPTTLKIAFDPGDVSTGVTITCPVTGTADLPVELYQPTLLFVLNGFFEPPDESLEYTLIDRAWTFASSNPFRATWDEEADAGLNGGVNLTLTHTPR